MGTWKAEAGLQIPSSLGYIVVSVSKRNRKLRESHPCYVWKAVNLTEV